MKTLTLDEINELKDKLYINHVIPSNDILGRYDTIEKLKLAELITSCDPSELIEKSLNPVGPDYSTQYLTFEAINSGSIMFASVPGATPLTISYSKDGENWTNLSSDDTQGVSLEEGEKILLKRKMLKEN